MVDQFSWVDEGVVPPVRKIHQHVCWAYATIAACESLHQIVHKPQSYKKLSTQHLIDCYDRYKDPDTYWGNAYKALDYIKSRNGGNLYSEDDYPHVKEDFKEPCKSKQSGPYPTEKGCYPDAKMCVAQKTPASKIDMVGVVRKNEKTLLEVVKLQPVIASMSYLPLASPNLDGKKIIRFSDVDPEAESDHCVLIVGFGSENGVDYWLCQNNYGTSFGDEGYFKIERNVNNPNGTANIAKKCVFPAIKGHGAALLKPQPPENKK